MITVVFPSTAALFVSLFHLVYIIQQTSIWSFLTRELSACHPNISCLPATHHHEDESSADVILSRVSQEKVTTAWRENILTRTKNERSFWEMFFFQQTSVKTISEGGIRASMLLCFELLTDKRMFLTPAVETDFDG